MADAWQYDEFTRTIFARVYPVIADQILERTGITHGTCLDVGSGPALLAISVALLSDLRLTALDSSPEMYRIAYRNIRDRCLEDQVVPVTGDVHAIPAPDATFDLVISRGSFHAWTRLPAAFREINRVLKPHGMAYVGGGYGSARIRDEVLAGRKGHGISGDPDILACTSLPKTDPFEIRTCVEAAGICDYRIINDDSGFWIIIKKSDGEKEQNIPASGTSYGPGKLPVFHDGFFFTK